MRRKKERKKERNDNDFAIFRGDWGWLAQERKKKKNYFSFHSGHNFICYREIVFLSEKDGINKEFFFLILCTYFCALTILTHDFSGGNYLETSTQRNESHCLSKKNEKSLSFLKVDRTFGLIRNPLAK